MAEGIHSKEANMDEYIPINRARRAICFPDPGSTYCDKLIESLTANGIRYFVNKGPLSIAGYNILGKGWASNVFLAILEGRTVAVKALKPGSRRASLLHEAAMLLAASSLAISPRPYKYTELFIAMQYIDGTSFIKAVEQLNAPELYYVLRRLLTKANLLDLMGISHNELARPHQQVLVEHGSLEPYIIDFESATVSDTPSNLTQLVGGITRIQKIRNKIYIDIARIRNLLKRYKYEKNNEKKAIIVNLLIKEITPIHHESTHQGGKNHD